MIDLHTHTFASDGVLVPSELIRRALDIGYRAIGLTDHADESNVEDVVRRAVAAERAWKGTPGIRVVPGVEITHVPPARIAPLAARARELGARLVIVHGETVVEPVEPGTNAAAIACRDVDILAHPGLLSPGDAREAARAGTFLEITARRGHAFGNGHTARTALSAGASLILNSDAHEPKDLITLSWGRTVLAGAGLASGEIDDTLENAEKLLERV